MRPMNQHLGGRCAMLHRRALRASILLSFLFVVGSTASSWAQATAPGDDLARKHSVELVFGSAEERSQALGWMKVRGNLDMAAVLILALRYVDSDAILPVLRSLTGETKAKTWFDWMVWQEGRPDIRPHPSYLTVHLALLVRVDPAFTRFVPVTARYDIRPEEITWGGVRVDGIPALVDPRHVAAAEATYLRDEDLVFGVSLNGDARAYPLRILDWHEMFNDTVGGMPVALAYCTLCGSGILFDRRAPGRAEPFEFGSSGLLYRSNKLMYDRQTDTLWNQFTGRPVVGALAGSGIRLRIVPVAITSWKSWRTQHPNTKVLSIDTGHARDYRPGAAYGTYFASPDLMFPAATKDGRLKPKDYVFGIRAVGGAKAWPVEAFRTGRVINDRVGTLDVVLIGNAETRTVRAYQRAGRTFASSDSGDALTDGSTLWQIGEEALLGPKGQRLPRVAGHVAYWFAWAGYLGGDAELATATAR
jgi:hypothetical protein